MKEESIRRAHIAETGESPYAVSIEVSGYRWKGDEPEKDGGGGVGPAPYDTLLAALGECTAMTVRWYAIQYKLPLERVEVELTHRKGNPQGGPGKTDIFTKRITLHGHALSEEQRQKLIDVAGKCPVQRTLEGTPLIETVAS